MIPNTKPLQGAEILPPDPSCDAIIVSHVSKRFVIRHKGTVKRAILGVLRPRRMEPFTALDDVSFRIPHGQTVAVIGRNGSGKSTLLSLLGRVYLPTSGSVELYGAQGGRPRVAPLLELGAGFHPDLTGLDNITFYAAMLGMTAREISGQIDSIVEFSELADKIDTDLRNWNSGAKLRLGFAIAVHTNPDILLVDEVLAVGDEAFQTKCMRFIAQLQEAGKTIVLVSHDLNKVERIASRVIWLNKGHLEMDGDVQPVLQAYREASSS